MSFLRRLFGLDPPNASHTASNAPQTTDESLRSTFRVVEPVRPRPAASGDSPIELAGASIDSKSHRPTDEDLRSTFGVSPSPIASESRAGKLVAPTIPKTPREASGSHRETTHIGRGRGGFNLKIVGESFHQATLEKLFTSIETDGRYLKAKFHVEREPSNPYDRNAVAVLSESGDMVGHFARGDAARYAPVLDRLLAEHTGFYCVGKLTGGHGLSIGVILDVAPPETLEQLGPKPAITSPPPPSSRSDHGQPSSAVNLKKRSERDVTEILGLVKGLLADSIVNDDELRYLNSWGANHPDAIRRWPVNALFSRLQQAFADGAVDEDERTDLAETMREIVGGQISVVLAADAPTTLPVDDPAPSIIWNEGIFVLTGRFAYGTRDQCEREILSRGGRVGKNITKSTSYLVLGTFSSEDWSHTSYGRKIERACELRNSGAPIHIVTEDHWAHALGRTNE
jgi:hypothetical protein